MGIALIDTNILIDYFDGLQVAARELGHYSDLAISNITYMEFVIGLRKQRGAGSLSIGNFDRIVTALRQLRIVPIDGTISERAIDVRSNSLLSGGKVIKLPDAIIFATALVTGRYLVTRDARGFTGTNVRTPYQLSPTGVVYNVASAPPA